MAAMVPAMMLAICDRFFAGDGKSAYLCAIKVRVGWRATYRDDIMTNFRNIFTLILAAVAVTACTAERPRAAAEPAADTLTPTPAVADTVPTGLDTAPAAPIATAPDTAAAPDKSATEQRMEEQGMVEIITVAPDVRVSLMYGRADNFTGRVLYTDLRHAYLHPEAARALRRADDELRRLRPDLRLKVYDAARPMSVQQHMYDVVAGTPKNIYVSNPRNGGGLHNYGLAVDITLCDAATGDSLPMGTLIDHMGPAAHVANEAQNVAEGRLTPEAVANRELLRQVMAAGGFKVLPTEWWHFNLKSRAEARRRYKVIR